MRLIDGDRMAEEETEAFVAAKKQIANMNLLQTNLLAHAKVQKLIADTPTVDAVPVVRCRECKYYQPEYWGEVQVGYPCKCDGGMTNPEPESYCSLGERRDADGQE